MCRFNSQDNKLDLGKDCDDLINTFLKCERDLYSPYDEEDIVECCVCDEEDIDNKYNFVCICRGCYKKMCISCYEENESCLDINNFICNYGVEENCWLCYDCGVECDGCDEYVNEDYMVGMLKTDGDYDYKCRSCVCGDYLDFVFENITYSKEGCELEMDCKELFVVCCECGEEDCECCKCDDECEGECMVEVVKCCSCKENRDYEEYLLFRLDDGRIVCEECVDFDVRYI